MLGGVAAGLGDYFAVDPTLVRIIFVVSLFLGGAGVLAYIILWIITPEEPFSFYAEQAEEKTGEGESTQESDSEYKKSMEEQKRKRSTVLGVILIVVGFFFLADNFIPRVHFFDLFPIVLIAIGIGLLLNTKRRLT